MPVGIHRKFKNHANLADHLLQPPHFIVEETGARRLRPRSGAGKAERWLTWLQGPCPYLTLSSNLAFKDDVKYLLPHGNFVRLLNLVQAVRVLTLSYHLLPFAPYAFACVSLTRSLLLYVGLQWSVFLCLLKASWAYSLHLLILYLHKDFFPFIRILLNIHYMKLDHNFSFPKQFHLNNSAGFDNSFAR